MAKICEGIINVFSFFFFGENKMEKKKVDRDVEYTLSSVFPTSEIMCEVKKHI